MSARPSARRREFRTRRAGAVPARVAPQGRACVSAGSPEGRSALWARHGAAVYTGLYNAPSGRASHARRHRTPSPFARAPRSAATGAPRAPFARVRDARGMRPCPCGPNPSADAVRATRRAAAGGGVA